MSEKVVGPTIWYGSKTWKSFRKMLLKKFKTAFFGVFVLFWEPRFTSMVYHHQNTVILFGITENIMEGLNFY